MGGRPESREASHLRLMGALPVAGTTTGSRESCRWTLGSYAAFGPGQMTRCWHGVGVHNGRVHFAGEHTSTYSQGFLNGGVESGDRAAIEVMRAIGVPVPQRLSSLPYSTFT
jgi:hypothetical protein